MGKRANNRCSVRPPTSTSEGVPLHSSGEIKKPT
nr:MAG TPA: hypothetical protein [Caudoviricetes sp.]